MYREIRIPRLGWSMEEGTFISWRKRDGDEVRVGEPLFELEGDKAIQEIESVDAGVLRIAPDAPAERDVVAVGRLIGVLVPPGGQSPWESKANSATAAECQPVDSPAEVASLSAGTPANSGDAAHSVNATTAGELASRGAAVAREVVEREVVEREVVEREVVASPRARRAARARGVDLTKVTGGGSSGRIRERDVLTAASVRSNVPPTAHPNDASIPVTSLRRTIAERMKRSLAETAPVTLTSRADATNLVSLRRQFQSAGRDAVVPSYTDVLAKLAAIVLERHPLLAARWAGDCLQFAATHDIGVAVDTPDGLLVPVLRNVRSQSLVELARQSADLIERARSRRISADELQGGAFTISNLGAFGIDAFAPIINWPESSVLGVGAIRREAAVLEQDRIEARWRVTLSLTFDHRVVDGAPAARFLQELVTALENPAAWLIG